jgi:DNA-binding MarR family transcriptional regulator
MGYNKNKSWAKKPPASVDMLHFALSIMANKEAFYILNRIAEVPGISVSDLANETGERHQRISYHCRRMAKAGLITKKEYETDFREIGLHMNPLFDEILVTAKKIFSLTPKNK